MFTWNNQTRGIAGNSGSAPRTLLAGQKSLRPGAGVRGDRSLRSPDFPAGSIASPENRGGSGSGSKLAIDHVGHVGDRQFTCSLLCGMGTIADEMAARGGNFIAFGLVEARPGDGGGATCTGGHWHRQGQAEVPKAELGLSDRKPWARGKPGRSIRRNLNPEDPAPPSRAAVRSKAASRKDTARAV